jgi:predicted DNA-binding transcriptional regulator AlpA
MEHHPNEERLLSITELMRAIGLRSRTSIYRQIKFDPDFPRPLKLGARSVRFRRSDVANYMQQLATPTAATDAGHD